MGCVVPAAFCIRCFYGCRFARLSDVLCPLLLRMEGLGGSSAGLFFPGFSFGDSLPSACELPQTLLNVAVDNRC